MKKALFLLMAMFVAVPVAFAAPEAPDFASIADALKSASTTTQPVVQDVDFSKAESNIMAYIAAISRQADQPAVPFAKLAQQYIWSGTPKQGSAVIREGRAGARPYIMVGGYWDTQVTATAGGTVTLLCYVSDPDGYADIDHVELYYGQTGTGVNLHDDATQGDFAPADGVFGLQFPITPPNLLPAGRYLLELRAFDKSGLASDIWPYLTINP
jgi:hypothetical protein